MRRYMVVAHQTADSPELASTLQRVLKRDPKATFVLVVPATHPRHGGTWTESEARDLAAEVTRIWGRSARWSRGNSRP
jgi:hypothetical protein